MSTEFTPLTGQTDDASFTDTMDSVLKLLEGDKTVPYLDTRGHVTIGIGVNLADYPNSYFQERGDLTDEQKAKVTRIIKKTYATTTKNATTGKTTTVVDYAGFAKDISALGAVNLRII